MPDKELPADGTTFPLKNAIDLARTLGNREEEIDQWETHPETKAGRYKGEIPELKKELERIGEELGLVRFSDSTTLSNCLTIL